MASSRQTRRWGFVIRSQTVVRTWVSCSAFLFIIIYFAIFSYDIENSSTYKWESGDSIISQRVNQRNLKSEKFLSRRIRNEANDKRYPLKPNDNRSPLYIKKKFKELCPLVSPLLGKHPIISIYRLSLM